MPTCLVLCGEASGWPGVGLGPGQLPQQATSQTSEKAAERTPMYRCIFERYHAAALSLHLAATHSSATGESVTCDAPVFISAYRLGYHLAPSPCCPAQEAALCERRLDDEALCKVGGTPAVVHLPPDPGGSILHLLA